jgi:hypothetical protein
MFLDFKKVYKLQVIMAMYSSIIEAFEWNLNWLSVD